MSHSPRIAEVITKQSKSNLALALRSLPKERRNDVVTFYAFCRIVDDIADDLDTAAEEKAVALNHWKNGLSHGFDSPTEIENEVVALRDKYGIPNDLFIDLISGCEMDLEPLRFQQWEDLQKYTYKVAGVVGLISLYIFGADPERSKDYALKLGHALQLTNILRDVGEDLDNGSRIYLPLADLEKFDYSEADLLNKVYDERFIALMEFQYNRALRLYKEAIDSLHPTDYKALKAARIMGTIYSTLLEKISTQSFQVFHQRISISKTRKVLILLKGMAS